MQTRVRRAATAGALALLTVPLAGAAQATVPVDESVHLSWNGRDHTGVTTQSFLGTPVAVPGDSASRTLLVRNDGPTTGVLRASIVNVELLDPDASDVHHAATHTDPDGSDADVGDPYRGAGDQGDFYEDLVLSWPTGSASFAELDANGVTPFLEAELANGGEVPITLGYELPVDATSGNRANVAPRQASFDVLLEIGGDLPTDQPAGSGQPVPPGPPTGVPDTPPRDASSTGELGRTGAEVRVLAGLAALAVGLGAAARAARRAAAHPAGSPPGS